MKVLVSIILLNYNWKQFNKDCIDSILLQTYKNFEIIFVDQCSTDWSLEEVENLYKKKIKNWKIKIIKNPENNWFTWWNNLGIKCADKNSKYICLLNNDTTVPNSWLKKIIKWIESDEKIWAVSCNVWNRWEENKQKKQVFELHKKSVGSIFGEFVFNNMSDVEIKNEFYYTSLLGWCCLLYKKDIIEKPFIDSYFIYAEDVYLSLNFLSRWYKLWVCLDTYVNHYWSWTMWCKPSPFKLFHWNKNQIINFLIFYPFIYRLLLFPLFFIKEIAHLFMWSSFMRMKSKLKWRMWILQNYNEIKDNRNKIQINKKISTHDFINQLEFKLSDSYHVQNVFLKFLIYIWNLCFKIYGFFIVKPISFSLNLFNKKL